MLLESTTTSAILANKEAQKQARIIKALADPSRLHILRLLKQRGGSISVTEITEAIDMAQPTTSYHLLNLLNAGLVSYEKDGIAIFYRIEAQKMAEICTWIRDLIPAEGAST